MQIYVVQPGDTLSRIAQQFGTTVTVLQNANQPANPDQLVTGQALVIPGPAPIPLQYTVQPGDTLYQLALLFRTTVTAIAQANHIANPNQLSVGMVLTIPGWSQIQYTIRAGDTLSAIAGRYNISVTMLTKVNKIANVNLIYSGEILIIPQPVPVKPTIEVLAYFQSYDVLGLERSLPQIGHSLTYGAIFDFPVDSAGTIRVPNYLARIIADLKNYNIRPLVVITNLGTNGFDSDLARTILGDSTVKTATINNLLNILQQYGAAGVNVDFENMYPEDRQLYNSFISDLATALRPKGYSVSVAMAPKSADFPRSAWVGTFDYATIGKLADFVFLMTYDWGWIGGAPTAIAPIGPVRQVLTYAMSLMPATKIMMGIPFYAYNWPIPQTAGQLATPTDLVAVYELAGQNHANINYDATFQSPWFDYTDGQGQQHEVWFEDARSVTAKYNAVNDFKLRGAGYWSLWGDPYGFPQNWPILTEMFNIVNSLPKS